MDFEKGGEKGNDNTVSCDYSIVILLNLVKKTATAYIVYHSA